MSGQDFKKLGLSIVNSNLEVGTHELGSWNGDELVMQQGMLAFFDQKEKNDIKKSDDGTYTYYIYSALTNFKRAIFTCDEMKDNNGDGRIDSIVFRQI